MIFIPRKLIKSFSFACKGLKTVICSQQNFQVHIAVACVVIASGVFFKLTAGEWCLIVLTITLVLAMETLNTAIEKLVDFISPGFHPQAGAVKDISAAAVLITAIAAVIIGLIIFLPKLL